MSSGKPPSLPPRSPSRLENILSLALSLGPCSCSGPHPATCLPLMKSSHSTEHQQLQEASAASQVNWWLWSKAGSLFQGFAAREPTERRGPLAQREEDMHLRRARLAAPQNRAMCLGHLYMFHRNPRKPQQVWVGGQRFLYAQSQVHFITWFSNPAQGHLQYVAPNGAGRHLEEIKATSSATWPRGGL